MATTDSSSSSSSLGVAGKYEQRSNKSLSSVHPELKRRVEGGRARLALEGISTCITDGLRTFEEQRAIYAQGRTKPGQIVTYAGPGQSNHNYGLAIDQAIVYNGKIDYNLDNPVILKMYLRAGNVYKTLGLEWGGDWKKRDIPHFQLTGLSIKECFSIYTHGLGNSTTGINAVWHQWDVLHLHNQVLSDGLKPVVTNEPIPADIAGIIEFKDQGPRVKRLQESLAKLGLMLEHQIDGDFGNITKQAVISFQRKHNLTADGIAGPATLSALAGV